MGDRDVSREPGGETDRYAYPDTVGEDEQRRAFIAAHYLPNSSEIAGEALVANLTLIESWLRTGAAAVRVPRLRAVKP